MHICGPESKYDYSVRRIYTPPDALLPDYLCLAEMLGLSRVVFVQPSVYGVDNSAMVDAMKDCPLEKRGVVVVVDTVAEAELDALHQAGVRGIRFNIVDVASSRTQTPLDSIRRLALRIERLGWHIELLVHVDDHPDLDILLGDVCVDVVVGHLGYVRPDRTIDNEGFQALLRLMQAKLTGPYRISAGDLPYSGAGEFARLLVQEASERVL